MGKGSNDPLLYRPVRIGQFLDTRLAFFGALQQCNRLPRNEEIGNGFIRSYLKHLPGERDAPIDDYRAGRGPYTAGNDVEQRRLTDTVPADKPHLFRT